MHVRRLVPLLGCLLAGCGDTTADPSSVPEPERLMERQSWWPALSPDGTRLAWSGIVEGRGAIFVGGPDGSGGRRVTHGVWDVGQAWSPDGRWLAYAGESPESAAYDVWLVSDDGSETRQLTSTPTSDVPWYWLPDGSGVVFTRTSGGRLQTLVAPLDGGAVRSLLPEGPGNRRARLSPDGARAVEHVNNSGVDVLWLHDLESGDAVPLTTEGFEVIGDSPWSPDGRSVVYESRRTGTRDLWIADVETRESRALTTDLQDDTDARWSPDGRRIAFVSTRGGQRDLWVVAAEGGAPVRVTNDLAGEDTPTWTPDGHLVFARSMMNGALRIVSEDGSVRTVLDWPGRPTVPDVYQLDASTEAGAIVFTSERSGNVDLWTVPLAGGEATALTTTPMIEGSPRFSPDGRWIAFRSDRAGSADIWVMAASGGEPRRLTDWPSLETWPQWSPDGSWIAFVSDRDADALEVWVMPAEGGEAHRLSDGVGPVSRPLRWSPDGGTLYFIGRAEGGPGQLYRADVQGGGAVPVGTVPLMMSGDLSPDGTQWAYAARSAGWAWIEVVPVDGGPAWRLTPSTEGVWQPSVLWAPDGQSLFVSSFVYGDYDEYELLSVSWPDGEWSQLPSTPRWFEDPAAVTEDGKLVVASQEFRYALYRVRVDELLGAAGGG
jgi:TolB protein